MLENEFKIARPGYNGDNFLKFGRKSLEFKLGELWELNMMDKGRCGHPNEVHGWSAT